MPSFLALASSLPEVCRRLQLESLSPGWMAWVRSPTPESEGLPPGVQARHASPFVRLLLVQALRPDRLLTAMHAFVCDAMGVPSINPPPLSFARVADTTEPGTPVLLITTSGADPSAALAAYAAGGGGGGGGSGGFEEMAMGGGQQEEALRRLRRLAGTGGWLCLKNLHLVLSWLPTLEKELAGMPPPHPRFRLWLTTECTPLFPAALLCGARKVTFEAPPGVRNNLARTLADWEGDARGLGGGSPLRATLLFLLAWLHALVQERRSYVPQGWTKAYEFSAADLRVGSGVVDALLARPGASEGRVPWAFLHGLLENVVYGGRVDSPGDQRVLRAYLAQVIHPDVLAGRRVLSAGLRLPGSAVPSEYAALADALPEVDVPSLFSLPANIDRTLQRVASGKTLGALRAMSPTGGAAAQRGFNRAAWRAGLTPIIDAWERAGVKHAPSSSSSSSSSTSTATAAASSPHASFVALEIALAGRLEARVGADIVALRRLLIGTAGLPATSLLAVGGALLGGAVPDAWTTEWEGGPAAPLPWLAALASRSTALAGWAASATRGTLLAAPLHLAHLFRPATFLNALRQQTSRALAASAAGGKGAPTGPPPASMDSLRLVASWDPATLPPSARAAGTPSCVAQLSGLWLQGANLEAPSRTSFRDAAGDDPEAVGVPDLFVCWAAAGSPDPYPPTVCISVPLFTSLDREKPVTELSLPCGPDRAKWVLAGVCLAVERG